MHASFLPKSADSWCLEKYDEQYDPFIIIIGILDILQSFIFSDLAASFVDKTAQMEEDEYERLGKKLNVFIIYYLSSQFSWEMWNTSVKLKIYIFFIQRYCVLLQTIQSIIVVCMFHWDIF